jgi:hypothetical protein
MNALLPLYQNVLDSFQAFPTGRQGARQFEAVVRDLLKRIGKESIAPSYFIKYALEAVADGKIQASPEKVKNFLLWLKSLETPIYLSHVSDEIVKKLLPETDWRVVRPNSWVKENTKVKSMLEQVLAVDEKVPENLPHPGDVVKVKFHDLGRNLKGKVLEVKKQYPNMDWLVKIEDPKNPNGYIWASPRHVTKASALDLVLADSLVEDPFGAYLQTALWAEVDDNGDPWDSNYSEEDIAPESKTQMKQEFDEFMKRAQPLLQELEEAEGRLDLAQIAHDFWLTRNRHGAGFWETSDYPEQIGTKLTDLSHKFPEVYFWLAEDGKIHAEPNGQVKAEKAQATGEPDQDYDHDIYDAITLALRSEGFEASHKEFDKYQGVEIKVKEQGSKAPPVSLWPALEPIQEEDSLQLFVQPDAKLPGEQEAPIFAITVWSEGAGLDPELIDWLDAYFTGATKPGDAAHA